MRILAGDVGGTKTYLALYECHESGQTIELRSSRFDSPAFPGLAPMVRLFLGQGDPGVHRAAFGVAGPVIDDTCQATNLPWRLDARVLEKDLAIERVKLLNDFHAVALGIPSLTPSDTEVLLDNPTEPLGPIAVIGAGTGLGQAVILRSLGRLFVLPSEGGHCDFAPRNEIEIQLLRFLLRRHARVSYERVVSGPGLVSLYDFVVSEGLAAESPEVRENMLISDPSAVIGERALNRQDAACERAVELFVSLYAAEAGNLALKVLPTGGLYIAGGIAPKLIELLKGETFRSSFVHKGRMSPLLEAMRVAVVMNTRVGLLGAKAAAQMIS